MNLLLLLFSLYFAHRPPPAPGAAAAAADARRRLAHAYALLAQTQRPQPGRVAVLRFRSETTFVPPGHKQPATTTARFVFLSRAERTYLSNGDVDVYADRHTQVCVARNQRTILLTRAAPTAAGLLPWATLREQVVAQGGVVSSRLVPAQRGAHRRIRVVPAAGSPLRGHVAAVDFWLDARTDALQRVTAHYPPTSSIRRATLVLEEQSWKTADPAVDAPPLAHVLGPGQHLLPAYRHYALQDQRTH